MLSQMSSQERPAGSGGGKFGPETWTPPFASSAVRLVLDLRRGILRSLDLTQRMWQGLIKGSRRGQKVSLRKHSKDAATRPSPRNRQIFPEEF